MPTSVESINVIGCDEFASVELTSIKLVLVDNPEVFANPAVIENVDIPANQVVTSTKPVVCGRIDTILSRMENVFGEKPVMLGQTPAKGDTQAMVTMTYNEQTGSYTFLEQLPAEKRLICIISSGQGNIIGKSMVSSY